MIKRGMNRKGYIIPIITLVIAIQLTGCSNLSSKEMVDMINKGDPIEIELTIPDGSEVALDVASAELEWVQLDQLKTYNTGFRQAFNEIFNINIVTKNGVNGKSGSIYVDDIGDRNGNPTLASALRNKVFVEKYWDSGYVPPQQPSYSPEDDAFSDEYRSIREHSEGNPNFNLEAW